MDSFLLEKYGYVDIPEGQILMTRQSQNWKMTDNRVFFYVSEGCTFGGDVEYQFEVSRKLRLITPFTCDTTNVGISRSYISSLCQDLGITLFDDVDDLYYCSPEWKTHNSDELLKKLSEYEIDGWYHPVESSTYIMEICLYRPIGKCTLKSNHIELNKQPPIYAYLGTYNRPDISDKNKRIFKKDLKDTQLWHCLEYLVMHQKV